jgi:hypothetical protein
MHLLVKVGAFFLIINNMDLSWMTAVIRIIISLKLKTWNAITMMTSSSSDILNYF